MQNLEQTILAQYANSPTLNSVVQAWNSELDPTTNINNFYNNVWNIETATGYGLQVWGRIVNIGNTVSLPAGMPFGFEEATTASAAEFGQSNFYNGTQTTSNYVLSDPVFRTLILAKALMNISTSTSSAYNQILMALFPGRGNAYVTNLGNMQARLTFEFTLQPYELAIIKQTGAITPPTGVLFDVMQVQLPFAFGFAEADGGSAFPAVVINSIYAATWQGNQLQYTTPRTNYLDNAALNVLTQCTATYNNATSPDGTTDATLITLSAAVTAPVCGWTSAGTPFSSTNFSGLATTFSVYVLVGTLTCTVDLFINDGSGTLQANSTVNIATGAITNIAAGGVVVTPLAGGWYCFAITATFAGGSANGYECYVTPDASSANDNQTFWIANSQFESGAGQTSFIPTSTTSGATVTDYTPGVDNSTVTFSVAPAATVALTWNGTAQSNIVSGDSATAQNALFGTGNGTTTTFNMTNNLPITIYLSGLGSATGFNTGTLFEGYS